ncbi:hypothetical protein DCCM_4730 [Desulfocucumis palustris]|uniref:Uncharacterized protein n=1 Tax=Desulfocucumis palustris TaxID=1898651 RepID=A0A2L2XNQ3_9FIRM|nr:hypothetical protein DCCM_4730 [Desulfocucumis palustris]
MTPTLFLLFAPTSISLLPSPGGFIHFIKAKNPAGFSASGRVNY